MQHIVVYSCCSHYNQGSILNLLKTPLMSERPDLWHKDLGVQNNLLQILGILPPTKMPTTDSDESEDSEDQTQDDELLNIRADIVDEYDRNPNLSTSPDNGQPLHVTSNDIRDVLLGSHKNITEDILISLLCSQNGVKWSNYNCHEFYEFAFSSTAAIYNSMTIHDLDITISVLHKWECCECPLGIKLNGSKLQKANLFGFILGHSDLIHPKRPKAKLKSLQELACDEIKLSVPMEVLRVVLAQFNFRIMLPLWMDRSPVPICYEIPIEPDTFDVFSYPEFCAKWQQLEPRIIDPSHVLTNLRVHSTQKGILGCDPKAFLRVSDKDNNVLSRGLIVGDPILDQRSVPFARKIFSSDVEDIMKKNGDLKEANLVKLI